jgi:hypothetical protein
MITEAEPASEVLCVLRKYKMMENIKNVILLTQHLNPLEDHLHSQIPKILALVRKHSHPHKVRHLH